MQSNSAFLASEGDRRGRSFVDLALHHGALATPDAVRGAMVIAADELEKCRAVCAAEGFTEAEVAGFAMAYEAGLAARMRELHALANAPPVGTA